MAHTAEELAHFQDSETRLVFARRRDDPRVIVAMPDGGARAMRELTRRELRCIVEDCPSPELKAVSRSRARDGFSHLAGGGHAGVGLHHLQGQVRVATWVTGRYGPHLEVAYEATTEDGARRADVMLTSNATGQQVAVEIQYAALSPDDWQARHASYLAVGVTDVWLFGHTGAHLRSARDEPVGVVRLNPTHEAVVAAGLPLLWLNPITGQAAWAVVPRRPKLLARNGYGELRVRPLREFILASDGLHHPELDRIRRRSAEFWAAKARQEAEQLAARAAAEEAKRAKIVRRSREAWDNRIREEAARHRVVFASPTVQSEQVAVCSVCGKPLADVFMADGMHSVCDPAWKAGRPARRSTRA